MKPRGWSSVPLRVNLDILKTLTKCKSSKLNHARSLRLNLLPGPPVFLAELICTLLLLLSTLEIKLTDCLKISFEGGILLEGRLLVLHLNVSWFRFHDEAVGMIVRIVILLQIFNLM